MLAQIYEIKDELKLFFEAYGKQDLLLSIESQEFHLTLADLVNFFEVLNVLNLILQVKNINRISDYDAINTLWQNWSWASSN